MDQAVGLVEGRAKARFLYMPAGRPTKYKKEYCQKAEEFLSQGYSQEAFAGQLGITEQTLYNWLDKHPAFFESVKKGVAVGRKFWEEMGIDRARGKIDGFNSAAWIFNMKNRHGWRDKQEVSGPDGGPIKTESKVLEVVGVRSNADRDS